MDKIYIYISSLNVFNGVFGMQDKPLKTPSLLASLSVWNKLAKLDRCNSWKHHSLRGVNAWPILSKKTTLHANTNFIWHNTCTMHMYIKKQTMIDCDLKNIIRSFEVLLNSRVSPNFRRKNSPTFPGFPHNLIWISSSFRRLENS